MTMKKFLSVAKMAPTVYETETCYADTLASVHDCSTCPVTVTGAYADTFSKCPRLLDLSHSSRRCLRQPFRQVSMTARPVPRQWQVPTLTLSPVSTTAQPVPRQRQMSMLTLSASVHDCSTCPAAVAGAYADTFCQVSMTAQPVS